MKSSFYAVAFSGLFVFSLVSCNDPATDIKDGEEGTAVEDTALIAPPGYNYPTDTMSSPLPADTTSIQR